MENETIEVMSKWDSNAETIAYVRIFLLKKFLIFLTIMKNNIVPRIKNPHLHMMRIRIQ